MTDLFTQTPSRLLWETSSHMLQLMREGCSYTYPPLSIARYSFLFSWVKWSNVEWKHRSQDSNPGSRSRESEALLLSHCALRKKPFSWSKNKKDTRVRPWRRHSLLPMATGWRRVPARHLDTVHYSNRIWSHWIFVFNSIFDSYSKCRGYSIRYSIRMKFQIRSILILVGIRGTVSYLTDWSSISQV